MASQATTTPSARLGLLGNPAPGASGSEPRFSHLSGGQPGTPASLPVAGRRAAGSLAANPLQCEEGLPDASLASSYLETNRAAFQTPWHRGKVFGEGEQWG